MPPNYFEFWWCCIHAADRSMLRTTSAAFLLTLYLGMPLDLWFAAWASTGRDGAAYQDAWLLLYHAEIGTMIAEGSTIDAVIPVAGYEAWWADLVLWQLDPLAACLSGCTQSQRPVP